MSTMQQKSLYYLHKELRNAKISLGHAESKPGAEDEIRNLEKKIAMLEWTFDRIIALPEEGDDDGTKAD